MIFDANSPELLEESEQCCCQAERALASPSSDGLNDDEMEMIVRPKGPCGEKGCGGWNLQEKMQFVVGDKQDEQEYLNIRVSFPIMIRIYSHDAPQQLVPHCIHVHLPLRLPFLSTQQII